MNEVQGSDVKEVHRISRFGSLESLPAGMNAKILEERKKIVLGVFEIIEVGLDRREA